MAKISLSRRVVIAGLVTVGLIASLFAQPAAAASGDLTWDRLYNGPADQFDYGHSVATSPDGSMVVTTGDSGNAANQDYATIAYDPATGDVLWSKRYNGPANGQDLARSVAISLDSGMVAVTGRSDGKNDQSDAFTIVYDSKGNVVWKDRFDGASGSLDGGNAVAFSPDGLYVYITGYTYTPKGKDYLTIAYDSSTGGRLWTKRYNGPPSFGDEAIAVSASANGKTVVVTGVSPGNNGSLKEDFLTLAYDSTTGATLWTKRYNGPGSGYDTPYAMQLSPDGQTAFVCGESPGVSDDDFVTIAYNVSTGAQRWIKRYNGPANVYDGCYGLAVAPDGSTVVVTGDSVNASGNGDFETIAYDAVTGAQKWIRRIDGPAKGEDSGNAVAISPDGTAIVTGLVSAASPNIFTVAYDTTGQKLWSKAYDGSGHDYDQAYAVAVVPHSDAFPDTFHVAVVGEASNGTNSDSATILYEL